MKFHWGHGIAVFFSVFVIFMLTLLYLSRQERIDLVTDEYYAEEIKYEDRLNQIRNANEAGLELFTTKNTEFLELELRGLGAEVKGTVFFYRPSDASLDLSIDLELDSNSMMKVPLQRFAKGMYSLQVEIEANGKSYFLQKNLSI